MLLMWLLIQPTIAFVDITQTERKIQFFNAFIKESTTGFCNTLGPSASAIAAL
jgi:hypothetical protein